MAQTPNRVTKRIAPEVGPKRAVAETLNRQVETIAGGRRQTTTNVTNITNPVAGISSLAGLAGVVALAALNNVKITIAGATITIEGRKGPRLGFQNPANGANIVIGDDDYTIYGTGAQHCNNVTFPLAASFPGKVVIFTYPPGGSLTASGSDTVDAYANQTACYQSDGISRWFRVWSI